MTRDIPEPTFIEFEQTATNPGRLVEDLGWQRVVEFLRSRELSSSTLKAYERQLKLFYTWTQNSDWHNITHRDIDRYKQHLKSRPSKRGGTLSPTTINQALATLKSFFKWLTVKDYITRNPTLTIEFLKEPAKPPRDLAETQVNRLFESLVYRGDSEVRDRAILQVLSHGLRAREVCGLDISDYDGRRLKVREAKWGSDGLVPLKPAAISALDSYLGWLIRNGFTASKETPLFISLSNNSRGKRLGYSGIYDLVKDLAKASELDDIHPHRMRHTFATSLVAAGMNPLLAKRAVRIRSDKIFARYSDRALDIKMEEAFKEIYGGLEES
ncbi:tyrosine-type recombinase/integrase [Leptothoe kymatousa]|uniref:Tyrosine-type recombinase/integrase n=1 Tax=Leptothoe kymatousa TAU-MAC 1615 TaxID=2364775 RepID=A0ABS5Y6U8_9CYAN|nr:tyrosine-type recombinase/integrase [Leptothoe kymatousa]MBT9313556.1 tyrosine-type recombinase/integrase [Leptothoe kymatousa TAU-MAC 1615]